MSLMPIDWVETLKSWRASVGAIKVEDSDVNNIISFMRYVGKNCFGKIEYYEAHPSQSKQQLERDVLGKAEIFEIAADQLSVHRSVWREQNSKFPDRATFELPFHPIKEPTCLRYLKFQFKDKSSLNSPKSVQKVFLRYHISDTVIEVIFEKVGEKHDSKH